MQKLLFDRCKGNEDQYSIQQENTNSVSEILENPIEQFMGKSSLKEFDHIKTIDQRYNTLSKVSPQESLEKIENKIKIATIKQKPK